MFRYSSTSAESVTFMYFTAKNHLPLIIDEIGDQMGRTSWVPVSPNPRFKRRSPAVPLLASLTGLTGAEGLA